MSTHRTPEQLPLLSVPDIPLQFRLNEQTRRVGLANVASIKALLAAQESRRLARLVEHHQPAARGLNLARAASVR